MQPRLLRQLKQQHPWDLVGWFGLIVFNINKRNTIFPMW